MGTSSEYSGFTQVDRGNIVVSINYRLGPLGWFHYYDEGRDTKIECDSSVRLYLLIA